MGVSFSLSSFHKFQFKNLKVTFWNFCMIDIYELETLISINNFYLMHIIRKILYRFSSQEFQRRKFLIKNRIWYLKIWWKIINLLFMLLLRTRACILRSEIFYYSMIRSSFISFFEPNFQNSISCSTFILIFQTFFIFR